jgi:hypothetical protein
VRISLGHCCQAPARTSAAIRSVGPNCSRRRASKLVSSIPAPTTSWETVREFPDQRDITTTPPRSDPIPARQSPAIRLRVPSMMRRSPGTSSTLTWEFPQAELAEPTNQNLLDAHLGVPVVTSFRGWCASIAIRGRGDRIIPDTWERQAAGRTVRQECNTSLTSTRSRTSCRYVRANILLAGLRERQAERVVNWSSWYQCRDPGDHRQRDRPLPPDAPVFKTRRLRPPERILIRCR